MRMKPCLTPDDAHKMMDACKTEAERNRWDVTIAIVDDAGYLMLLERTNNATPVSADVALGKARTAAITRRPTKFWEDRVKERPVFLGYPADLLIQGGLPVMHQKECVGAIGVSGVQSHEDEQIAQAGIAALG